jgi:hypothetical protein
MATTHFLKLERLQYRGLRIALGLMQSTTNNSLGVLSGVSPLAEGAKNVQPIKVVQGMIDFRKKFESRKFEKNYFRK